ncbi:MAG: chaperone modulator CbpM [Bacteriovorax sp.]|nr:chaperone modulator CbpM [Bacteriovorax sp.]
MRALITFEIAETAYRCRLSTGDILLFINHEWILPYDLEKLLFDEDDIARIILISELREDLGVNNEGVPIILHLIDQLNHLHLIVRREN